MPVFYPGLLLYSELPDTMVKLQEEGKRPSFAGQSGKVGPAISSLLSKNVLESPYSFKNAARYCHNLIFW